MAAKHTTVMAEEVCLVTYVDARCTTVNAAQSRQRRPMAGRARGEEGRSETTVVGTTELVMEKRSETGTEAEACMNGRGMGARRRRREDEEEEDDAPEGGAVACAVKNTGDSVNQSEYASIIVSLRYATDCTRPDIAYAVGLLCYSDAHEGMEFLKRKLMNAQPILLPSFVAPQNLPRYSPSKESQRVVGFCNFGEGRSF
ncbi:pentatricopeptide repeat-containing protein [Cucumis melo var. makuwa]|uniref:Pentatricopeptide repeat-containing protein n=1 Tax=Cucumis melo var. makuwa TaxID=1194695 RepID=A0A5A7SPS2_CUCMM|nr:pentatricopeptide repeat-containing protein [Cucumis melo var. makuwa]